MTTLHLVIVSATVLAALAIVVRAVRPATTGQASGVLAAQIGVAVAERLKPPLQLIAEQTRPSEQSAPAPRISGEDVVVHTRKPDAQSIRGVVAGDYIDLLILRDAAALSDGRTVPADGIVRIPKAGISFVQHLVATDVAK